MEFGAQKKLVLDRRAGLVFGWRGLGPDISSRLSALLITVGILLFALYAVRINLGEEPRDREITRSIALLDKVVMPERMQNRLETEALTPSDLYFSDSAEVFALQELNKIVAPSVDTSPKLQSLPEGIFEKPNALPVLTFHEEKRKELSEAPNYSFVGYDQRQPFAVVEIADAEARARWNNTPLEIALSRENISVSEPLAFSVGIDANGKVTHCLPLRGDDLKLLDGIRDALIDLNFASAEQSLQWTILNVRVEWRPQP